MKMGRTCVKARFAVEYVAEEVLMANMEVEIDATPK